ncbi:MAG: hypothetical protein GWN99_14930 [Gemmatimonadetes bacterium]|uniref:HPt domain-containing protein n=1 Tax=Candidatus Kutchimonas denitrificans TaxID=3056748 RepID=A0AAE4ZAY8_9BACT|nr:hypothetical protein [Gemmatimonadota bacterium]NIR76318.1 hypothetical protein [Candidatus Kutchimonas denitrificans]NIS02341.1 hypothetical protein [Gemmatimonadota bacterium]NIT68160.1 hypothetical protein [Gemmatimonadota bacterium]NIU54384.1 hypothetical protein [Gemmatimonadota bacterium]
MPDEPRDVEELLAEVYREFREGLPVRLEALRSALTQLIKGWDETAADLFYRTAHTLKGTAASFDADELVTPATVLADLGLRWEEKGTLDRGEIEQAVEELERLAAAIEGYVERMEGEGSG